MPNQNYPRHIKIPDHLVSAMGELLQKAEPTGIDHGRIELCAWLFLVAKNRPEGELLRGRRVPIPNYFLAGNMHGISEPDKHPEEVSRRYAAGRKASQRVLASAKGALTQFEKVFRDNLEALPFSVIDQAQELLSAFTEFLVCADPGVDHLKRTRAKTKQELDLYSLNTLALVWWRYYLCSPDEQYWRDMYELAKVWELTSAASQLSFTRFVVALTEGKDYIPMPPRFSGTEEIGP